MAFMAQACFAVTLASPPQWAEVEESTKVPGNPTRSPL